jgi:hypothetical protein
MLVLVVMAAIPLFLVLTAKAEQPAMQSVPVTKPVGEALSVNEFELQRDDLVGKVIELRFDRVLSFEEIGPGSYMAVVRYQNSDRYAEGRGLKVLVPKAGERLFENRNGSIDIREEKVYVQVVSPEEVKALGTYYAQDENGLHYGW